MDAGTWVIVAVRLHNTKHPPAEVLPTVSNPSPQQILHSSPSTEDDIIHRHTIVAGTNQRQREIILPYEATHGLCEGRQTLLTMMLHYSL